MVNGDAENTGHEMTDQTTQCKNTGQDSWSTVLQDAKIAKTQEIEVVCVYIVKYVICVR